MWPEHGEEGGGGDREPGEAGRGLVRKGPLGGHSEPGFSNKYSESLITEVTHSGARVYDVTLSAWRMN